MLSSNLFNYDKETKTLSAEASELQPHEDVGMEIWIKSVRTEREVLFEFVQSLHSDIEPDEVYGWEYKPAPEFDDVDVRLVVWND